MNVKELYELGNLLFGKRIALVSLWQELANNFYVERADFTYHRSLGTDFASQLMSSYPVLCRRDLGNQFSTMLRPTARPWFHPSTRFSQNTDTETLQKTQEIEEVMRRAMYDPPSMFSRATKEGDHDFAAFGQCVISIELGSAGNTMLYRCWHLRDCAWEENQDGRIGSIFRKWKPTCQQLMRTFKDVSDKVRRQCDKSPFEEVECMHMVVDADMYDDNAKGRPRWSIWYDVTNEHVMQAMPIWGKHYIIPRWQTVSNSQYSYSPATVAALPDARLLQAMTYTLLEAGEKATSPPMIATQDAVRSDVALYAGGITWVDYEYDERLGEALRPMQQDFRGFTFGTEMTKDSRLMIREAFYLNALTIPQRAPEMTAYEVGQRVQEYIRNALPLFEPMEFEYNAALCEETFGIMWRNGAFGDPSSWPKALRDAQIEFHFESPLHDAIEQQKGTKLQEMQQMMSIGLSLDPSLSTLPKAEVALRDALNGIGIPAAWQNNEDTVARAKAAMAAKQQAQEMLASMQQASEVGKNLGAARASVAQSQTSTPPATIPA